MTSLYPILWLGLLFFAYIAIAFHMLRRQKAKRRLRPPLELKLLRLPGESLRIKADKLLEQMVDWLLYGAGVATLLMIAPWLLPLVVPRVNGYPLLISSAALFTAAGIVVISRVVKLGSERSNVRLGYAGERDVAAQLHPLSARGCLVFHDVPIERDGYVENIDHVAVGPHGLVVIETKTRSIPTDGPSDVGEVTFDGERLIWPRYADDTASVRQVKRCAEWLGKLARDECGHEVPVQQIIAIPGWKVNPGKCYNPRVINPGALDAVFETMIHETKPTLKPAEIKRIANKLDALCRDADW